MFDEKSNGTSSSLEGRFFKFLVLKLNELLDIKLEIYFIYSEKYEYSTSVGMFVIIYIQ